MHIEEDEMKSVDIRVSMIQKKKKQKNQFGFKFKNGIDRVTKGFSRQI